MLFITKKVRNPLSACPPSSRVSPFCLRQSPTGRATLGSRTLGIYHSLCRSLCWCKKSQRTHNFAPSSGARRSLSRRRCASRFVTQQVSALYKNAKNGQSAKLIHNCEQSEQYYLPKANITDEVNIKCQKSQGI